MVTDTALLFLGRDSMQVRKDEDIEDVTQQYEEKIRELAVQVDGMAPNMRAVER